MTELFEIVMEISASLKISVGSQYPRFSIFVSNYRTAAPHSEEKKCERI